MKRAGTPHRTYAKIPYINTSLYSLFQEETPHPFQITCHQIVRSPHPQVKKIAAEHGLSKSKVTKTYPEFCESSDTTHLNAIISSNHNL